MNRKDGCRVSMGVFRSLQQIWSFGHCMSITQEELSIP